MTVLDNKLTEIVSRITKSDCNVSEEEYQKWKTYYDGLSEHDKVFRLLGALSQALLNPNSEAACAVLGVAVVCSNRWVEEKDNEEFLKGM